MMDVGAIPKQNDSDENDDGICWEALTPLHIEKIVDHSRQSFTVPFPIASREFVIDQDFEGRRHSAFEKEEVDGTKRSSKNASGIEEDLTERDSKTGSVLWDGAVVAASILERAHHMCQAKAKSISKSESPTLHNRLNPEQKVVVELGCGTSALPGQVANALGASKVIITDLDVIMKSDILQRNLRSNLDDIESEITCVPYSWGDEPLPKEMQNDVKLIVAADCIYDLSLVRPFVSTVQRIMKASVHNDCTALVTFDTSIGRHKAYSLFEEETAKAFNEIQHINVEESILIRDEIMADFVKMYVLAQPI